MNGAHELRQLAHLLRVGAETAKEIATLRAADTTEICALATQAENMADDLDRIAGRPQDSSHRRVS